MVARACERSRHGDRTGATPPSAPATCATTSWSRAPTGPSRSPTARCACWCCCTSTSSATAPSRSPSLFLFYEFFGIVTNLFGGWLAARFGLRPRCWPGSGIAGGRPAHAGVRCRSRPGWSVAYVMVAQALSGIAKDLTKMSAKSAIKLVVRPTTRRATLFQWVAILTGSKNALKGVGLLPRRPAADHGRLPAARCAMAGGLLLTASARRCC